MTGETWALVGVGVTLWGSLLGTILYQGRTLGSRIDALGRDLRSEMRDLRSEMGSRIDALGGRIDALAAEVRDLCSRVGKLEGVLSGLPWTKDKYSEKEE